MVILSNNPFRVLGAYANTAPKGILANKTKISTFLKVNKACHFAPDLESYLGNVGRTAETVQEADSKLTTEQDKLKYGQFWFFSGTPFDMVTTNMLTAGNLEAAIQQWNKQESMATLQNRAVSYLILGDCANAAICLSKLYTDYSQEFITALDLQQPLTAEDLIARFVSTLSQTDPDVDLSPLLNPDCSQLWTETVKKQMVEPLIKQLTAAVEECKSTKEKLGQERLEAGRKLNKVAKNLLFKLRNLLPSNDIQLTNICDKVANEVLQTSIDFYNKAGSRYASLEAKELLDAAEMLAKGSMIKDRIKENNATLSGIIDSLPPKEVEEEDRKIAEALQEYYQKPEEMKPAVTLLNETKPILEAIGKKLGETDPYYIEQCSAIVHNVMRNLISTVNATQASAGYGQERFEEYKHAVGVAGSLMNRLAELPMKPVVKNHFDSNRQTLSNLQQQIYQAEDRGSNGGTSGGTDDDNWGCIVQWIIYIGIFFLIQMCN